MMYFMSITVEYLRAAHQAAFANEAHGDVKQETVTLITAKLIPMATTELLMVASTLILEAVNMY